MDEYTEEEEDDDDDDDVFIPQYPHTSKSSEIKGNKKQSDE